MVDLCCKVNPPDAKSMLFVFLCELFSICIATLESINGWDTSSATDSLRIISAGYTAVFCLELTSDFEQRSD